MGRDKEKEINEGRRIEFEVLVCCYSFFYSLVFSYPEISSN